MDKKLIHKVTVKADPRYRDLSTRDKVKLMDEFLNTEGPKSLMVDFDFSHTGRKINRRIYSKIGHIQTAQDLVTPYLKPITLDHNPAVDTIIGRIQSAQYIPLTDNAMSYLINRGLNPNVYNDLDNALYKLDFQKIRDLLKRHSLQNDKNWMGIGKISAKARITDKIAIEKFLDGRYLTFSAETDSDMYVCSECLQDLYKDGPCDHLPGSKDAFAMTGNMIGGGSTVCTHPADDLSIGTNMYFDTGPFHDSVLDSNLILEDIMLVDSKQELVVIDQQELLMEEIIKKFATDQKLSAEEIEKLYDYTFSHDDLKDKIVTEDNKPVAIKDAKLTKKQKAALPKSVFAGSYNSFPIVDAAHIHAANWLLQKATQILKDEAQEDDTVCTVCLTEEEAKEVDWKKLDEELDAEVENDAKDAKLSTEARGNLSTSSFCGPDRSFPVPDCAHVTAARRLIGRASVSDDTKAKIMACVNKKAKKLGCDGEDSLNKPLVEAINKRAKAFGCTDIVAVDNAVDDTLTITKVLEDYKVDKLKNLTKQDFSDKVLTPVLEIAKGLDIGIGETDPKLATELADSKKKVNDLEATLIDITKTKNLLNDQHVAIKIEYKELLKDHIEIYRELDTKTIAIDTLLEKVVKVLKVLEPTKNFDDAKEKNIIDLLDSLDIASLESKLNDGLTKQNVGVVESPLKKVPESQPSNSDSLSSFEKNVATNYMKIHKEIGKQGADNWFSSKMQRYCSKDFHPSKFME